MKHLKYIIWILLVVLSAACEQLPFTEVTLKKQTVEVFDNNSVVLEVEFNPTAVVIQSVVVYYSTNSDMSHTEGCAMECNDTLAYKVKLTNLQKNTTYYVRYEVTNPVSAWVVTAAPFTTKTSSATPDDGTENGHEYVDLGLSVKWATCNVGATKPEEYGDYFAWGETHSKNDFSWDNYKYYNGSFNALTKYNNISSYGTVDNKKILDLSDDAAAVNWGGDWRMPTDAEWTELRKQCTWTWITQNGVKGYRVTGTNGNSIFFPVAGYRLTSDLVNAGSSGYYWSSSLDTDDPDDAYELGFNLGYVGRVSISRYYGQSVRPVYGAQKEETNNETYFSVSATKKVTFSPGNLQYHPANNKWRFAEKQTDYIDDANGNCSSTYNGWLDLFGCSTSANNFGVSTSTSDSDYSGSFVDWGTNQIGADAPNTWRTLTKDEWDYLRNTRTNARDLRGVAQVNGVNGLILLPDNWVCPSGISFKSGFHSNYGVDYYAAYQTFTASEWSKLEAAGAVFLPAAGSRNGSNVGGVNFSGLYWTATEYSSLEAYCLSFDSDGAFEYPQGRYSGQSVRLVKDL